MNHKPHVVVIMADQLRYDALGQHTPAIAKLRSESAVFERAYCTSPLCAPARGSFFTGKYPNTTGSIINPVIVQERRHATVQSRHATLYQLVENDWDSWHSGKQHLIMDPPLEQVADTKTHWLALEGRYESWLADEGVRMPGSIQPGKYVSLTRGHSAELAYGRVTRLARYAGADPRVRVYEPGLDHHYDGFILKDSLTAIKERDPDKPFWLNAMFIAPHPPLDIPEPWFSVMKDVELPMNVGEWGKDQSPLHMYTLPGVMGSPLIREEWREIWRVYLGLVAMLDYCVGKIVQELKDQGMYDDTLIIFTSDHGEMLGSHSLWQKMCMYEEAIRVPLLFKFPRSASVPVRCVAEPVSGVDVLPTLCDYTGIDAPTDVSGRSLMPLLLGDGIDREHVYVQYDGNGSRGNFQRAVVTETEKLIVHIFKDETFIELYDLHHDPQEMENLAFDSSKHGRRIEMLLNLLRIHMKATGDLVSLPDDVYERFLLDYSEFREEC